MKNALLGLTVPVLLIVAAASATLAYPVSAQAATYEVSGRVLDDGGNPLEGVQVSGYSYSESSSSSNDNDITDADGRFTLMLAEGKGSVSIYYEKWRRSDYREIVVTSDNADLLFTLQTPPPRTAIITGVVLGPKGEPIEGAEVQLSYGCCYIMPAEADPVASEPPTDGGGSAGSGGTTEPADPTAESKVAPEMGMTRPAIWPPPYDDYQTVKTDADGKFRFETYAGARQIVAWAKGFAQTTAQVEAKENQTIDVTIKLEKVPERTAILEGRVVNANTDIPIAGAHVSVRSLEWGRYAEATTDKAGYYRIQTVPGWSEVSVNVWASYEKPMPLATDAEGVSSDASSDASSIIARPIEQLYFPLSVMVKLANGETDEELKLEPKPRPTIALVGYVVDPDSKQGVEGANVNVWNHETGDWGNAITDATGSFKILVRAGHYSGSAYKDGYLTGTQSFEVTNDASQRIDILMPKGTTKYAPCYDETDCGPVIMYAEGAKSADTTASGIARSTPPAAPGAEPSASSEAGTGDESAAGAAGPDTSRAATFSGSGGGLPPYDAGSAGDVNAAERGAADVPALGVLALLCVAALGALAMRRRDA